SASATTYQGIANGMPEIVPKFQTKTYPNSLHKRLHDRPWLPYKYILLDILRRNPSTFEALRTAAIRAKQLVHYHEIDVGTLDASRKMKDLTGPGIYMLRVRIDGVWRFYVGYSTNMVKRLVNYAKTGTTNKRTKEVASKVNFA
ncbi:hypothetical protein OC844_007534, partial [Tilletia horrida]